MTTKTYEQLTISPAARKDGGFEVLRAGVANQSLCLTIRRVFDDPNAWGALLASAGRQVAQIYANELGLNEAETRARILAAFEAGMNAAKDPGTVTVTR